MGKFLLAAKGYARMSHLFSIHLLMDQLKKSHPKNTRFSLQRSSVKEGLHKERYYKKHFAKSIESPNLLIPPRGC